MAAGEEKLRTQAAAEQLRKEKDAEKAVTEYQRLLEANHWNHWNNPDNSKNNPVNTPTRNTVI